MGSCVVRRYYIVDVASRSIASTRNVGLRLLFARNKQCSEAVERSLQDLCKRSVYSTVVVKKDEEAVKVSAEE